MTNPTDLIAAYYKAIVDGWGPHLARMWQYPMDKFTADRWLSPAPRSSFALACSRTSWKSK
jgi:hypothetical protein